MAPPLASHFKFQISNFKSVLFVFPGFPLSAFGSPSMLYFVSGYTRSQIINSNGSPFSGPVVAALKSLELYDLFGDITSIDKLSVSEITTAGPSGAAGVLLSVGAEGIRPTPAAYHPERQAWKQVSSAVWIGMESDPLSGGDSPTPERLERETCVITNSENVILADGNIWEVPVIREPLDASGEPTLISNQRTSLPSVFYRNVNGDWTMEVVDQYADLWLISRIMLEKLLEGESIRYADLMTFAVQVLGLRYRFNLLVHSRWPERFLTTENVTKVVRAAIGYSILERQFADKKKAQPAST